MPQELLTEALEQLQTENRGLKTELYMRAAPRVAEMQTALSAIAGAAEKGDQSAKTMLHSFFEVWRRVEAAASGIVIPTQRPLKFEEPHEEAWSSRPADEPKSGI